MIVRTFPRSLAALDAIHAFIREFVGDRGLDADTAYDLDLMAEELFANMVNHGRGGCDTIEIGLDWAAPTVAMRLRDFDVEHFDPTTAPPVDVTQPIAERRRGGLGIHFVRQIADQIQYDYRGRASTITVTKRVGT